MFVEFECGCIGFDTPMMSHWHPNRKEELGNLLITRCDYDSGYDHEIGLSIRDVKRQSTPLSQEKVHEILKELDSLMYEAYKFREIKRLLA